MRRSVGTMLPLVIVMGILGAAVACSPSATATPTRAPATPTPTRQAPTATPAPGVTTAPAATATPTTVTTQPTATPIPGVTSQPTPTATPTRPVVTAQPTATATTAPTPSVAVKRGGIYNRAVTTKPAQFNIDFITSGPAGTSTNALLYNNLLTRDRTGKIIGELATSWEYQDNGQTLVLHLRSDVKFNDGTPMTAADVQWSIWKWLGLVEGHPRSIRMSSIAPYLATGTADDVQIVDNSTLRLKLKFAAPVLEAWLCIPHGGITKKGTTVAQLQQRPYGTGPWDFASEVTGAYFDLKPNPYYFKMGTDGKPLPYLNGVRSNIITDQTAGWTALLTQKIVIFSSDAGTPPDMVAPLKKLEPQGLVLENTAPGSQDVLVFNLARKDLPTTDVRVRKAINLAFSRKQYIDAVWSGLMARGGLFPVGLYTWSRTSAEYLALPGERESAADLDAAKQLMADAGFGSGFTIQMDTSDRFVKQAEYQCLELAKLKINCKLAPYPDATWDDHVAIDKACNLCSDSFAHLTTGDPDEPLFRHFYPGGARNNGSYEAADVTADIDKQTKELDPVKRLALVRSLEDRILWRDYAWVSIGFKIGTSGRWNYVTGNSPSDVYSGMANRIETVWTSK